MDSKAAFSIKPLRQQHFRQSAACLSEAFTKEPMVKALGIGYDEVLKSFSKVVEKAANEEFSFVAVEASTGSVAGVNINKDYTTEPVEKGERFSDSFNPIFALLEKLTSASPDIKNIGKSEVFHFFMVAVDEKFQSNNLGFLLSEQAINSAKEKQFGKMVLEASGPISQHIFINKLNFSEIEQVRYADFEFEGKKVFADIDEVESCKLLIQYL